MLRTVHALTDGQMFATRCGIDLSDTFSHRRVQWSTKASEINCAICLAKIRIHRKANGSTGGRGD